MAQMNTIKDFCEKNKIKWFPIYLKISTNEEGKSKKELMPIQHKSYNFSCPKTTDFSKLKKRELKSRQEILKLETYGHVRHIAMDTSNFFHIDIDTDKYEKKYDDIAKETPYFNSTTKSYGKHILVTGNTFEAKKQRYGFLDSKEEGATTYGVELLSGIWSYAPLSGEMHNFDMKVFDYVDIKKDINDEEKITKQKTKKSASVEGATPTKKKKKDENIELLFDIIKNDVVNGKKIISWDYWFQIGSVLKHNGYDEETFVRYSRLCSLCNDDETSKMWKSIKCDRIKMSIHTLKNIAKIVNMSGYYNWLVKFNEKSIDRALKAKTSETITRCFFKLFGDNFIYTNGLIYHFNGIFWKSPKRLSHTAVRRSFTSEFINIFREMQKKKIN